MSAAAALQELRDEASARFVGCGSVVGVGVAGSGGLVVLTSRPDGESEAAIREWAESKPVAVEVVLAGAFHAAAVPG